MIYVQHLMGIGHQRRMAAITRECLALGMRVTYVSGGMPLQNLVLDSASAVSDQRGRVQLVQLPPCRSPDLYFDRLVDAAGVEVDEDWRNRRCAALMSVWDQSQAGVLVVETYPFGRKLMRFELQPLLTAARRDGATCVSSIRDIIDFRPKRKKYQVMADTANAEFDRVLVHSDPSLVPLEASFPCTADIARQVTYTGFVQEGEVAACSEAASSADGTDEVMVSAGGGAYGEHLLRAAIAAQPLSANQNRVWRILVGENLPDSAVRALRAEAGPRIIVERARPDFRALLRKAKVSVSQGGYNTIMDILASRVRAVVVAYHDETEREQLLRGRVLKERDLIELLPNGELSAERLAQAVDNAEQRPRPNADIDTTGAKTSARWLHQWANSPVESASEPANPMPLTPMPATPRVQ
jgi:predicted glycosyltransferase